MRSTIFISLLVAASLLSNVTAQDGPINGNQALIVKTIGTGTPRFSTERSRAANLVQFGGLQLLVDMGGGTERRLHETGVEPRSLDHLLITHHHVDHNAELPQMLVSGSVSQRLKSITGPPGTSEFTRALQDFYMEDMLYRTQRRKLDEDELRSVRLQDVKGGESFMLDGLEVSTAQVNHTIHTVAYRFDAPDGASVVISGDLTYSESLVELAKGADILVIDSGGMPAAEGEATQHRTGSSRRRTADNRPNASQRQGQRPGGSNPRSSSGRADRERAHASLEDVAKMAQESGVETLVLTHIGHDRVDKAQVHQRVSAIYGGRVEIASDGDNFVAGIAHAVPVAAVTPVTRAEGRFIDNGDGTVSDVETGLTWQKSPDRDGDGTIDARDKITYEQALAAADEVELAGHGDWRLPTIKELYSLIDFNGTDPSGLRGSGTSTLVPFIDTRYFDFAYGDVARGERIIDSQYASSTLYVSTTGPRDSRTLFGVNFADGRIKGYGLQGPRGEKTFFVMYVRGEAYGQNHFNDNGNGTVSDRWSGLTWMKDDSGKGLDFVQAQAWIEELNASKHLGYSDWRLPTARELQGIVDYSRSPSTTDSAAIDPLFNTTEISNEAGQRDYPYFWTSDTHRNMSRRPDGAAVYVSFGRSMGYMRNEWVDAHGAGAQRSDPKSGNPDDYPKGRGPQGDAIRIYNYVRLVRSTYLTH